MPAQKINDTERDASHKIYGKIGIMLLLSILLPPIEGINYSKDSGKLLTIL
jgi:hypothetical protein